MIQNKENIGYGSACNLGAEKASGSHLLFINPDSELKPGTIDELIKATDRYRNASAFNPKIIDRTGKQDFKRRSVLLPKSEWMSKKLPTFDKDVSVLSGAAIFIKKEKFLQIKGFDEKIFLFIAETDVSGTPFTFFEIIISYELSSNSFKARS